jgi:branched-chain amino acid transport system ATP-binding protein
MSSTPLLKVEAIDASIGAINILHGVSLSVASGELVTVIGANGAGKTTLLRVISNVLKPRAGKVVFDGEPTTEVDAHRLARRGLIHVPQGRQIVPTLSVYDNLIIGAERSEIVDSEALIENLEREYSRFPVLRERKDLAAGSLSGGEQQMLAVSRALMMRPKLLMLDEPSLGLAPQIVRTILNALRQLADEGLAVLLVEQVAMAALSVADNAHVLRNGEVALSGTASDLRRDQALIESYLG